MMNSNNPDNILPGHVAIIMDGNGRWAKNRGKPRVFGHRRGVETVREAIRCCSEYGISHLTLFAFSSENWRRPEKEVSLLMELFISTLENEIHRMHENGVRLRVIGDITKFSARLQKAIKNAQALTQNNQQLVLTIAANYGGHWDIINSAKSIANDVKTGKLAVADINESVFSRYLSTADMPDPDLFIRTGGEYRISNFLLWQLAYTEMYFTDVFWPDFNEAEFKKALAAFNSRQRRFGLTGDQLKSS